MHRLERKKQAILLEENVWTSHAMKNRHFYWSYVKPAGFDHSIYIFSRSHLTNGGLYIIRPSTIKGYEAEIFWELVEDE